MKASATFLLLGLIPLLAGAAPAQGSPLMLHVGPATGLDEEGRGSAEAPLRTITYALKRADALEARDLEIVLGAGEYTEIEPVEGVPPREVYPLRLPRAVERIAIVGREGAVLSGSDPGKPLIEFELYEAAREARVELRSLELRGGLAGACFALGPGSRLAAVVEGCRFQDPSGRGLEMFLGNGSGGSLDVRGSEFLGGAGGVSVEGASASDFRLTVEGCGFESHVPYGPGGLLGASIEAHVDPAGSLEASILRNRFTGTASALQLTSAEPLDGAPVSSGGLLATFAGNLIHGRRAGDLPGTADVRNAIYLSVWPHHEIAIVIANNTFAGIEGHVVFQDNLDALPVIPWTFVNNIAVGTGGASEFQEEALGRPFPPANVAIIRNLLEKSSLARSGAAGNFSADPGFIDEAALDFRLSASSPARDRGDPSHAGHTAVDLAGNCRQAAPSCPPPEGVYAIDLGAYEFPGFCAAEVALFERGDCNSSGTPLAISDPIFTFGVLFLGNPPPACADACDANDDGAIDITDGVYSLSYLFLGGPAPPAPFGARGTDPTLDCLDPCR